MKKSSKAQTKAAKKLDPKAVKKVAATVSPKLSANHNETLLFLDGVRSTDL